MTFTDSRGHEYPVFEPGGIYLGSLHRGRVCFDHTGRKLKVISTGRGSVTVKRKGGDRETLILAPATVVYLQPGGAPPSAPKAQEEGPYGVCGCSEPATWSDGTCEHCHSEMRSHMEGKGVSS